MVEYTVIPLQVGKTYKVNRSANYTGDYKRFKQAADNLKKFILEGRPTNAVSPEHPLSKEELEEYRKFFCKKAQEDHINYIYFEDAVDVEEYDPMEDSMFADLDDEES